MDDGACPPCDWAPIGPRLRPSNVLVARVHACTVMAVYVVLALQPRARSTVQQVQTTTSPAVRTITAALKRDFTLLWSPSA